MIDYLIIGAGLFGATFARQMTDFGKKCLIIEKRNHIGGNCFSKNVDDIEVHMYGPHIFHTDSQMIWNFVQKFAKFNHFINRPKIQYKDCIYSFPINLLTFYQLWGTKNPQEVLAKLETHKIPFKKKPNNLEDWILSQVGKEIYEIFFKGYTKKQWGKNPNALPADIIKRIPFRLNFDDNYYKHRFQGIPIKGYKQFFMHLLKGIPIEFNTDYFLHREELHSYAKKIVYTGPLDAFYNFIFGKLEYRSLHFEHKILQMPDFQGNAIINYTHQEIPYTRIIEHKHFVFGTQSKTVITKEYPKTYQEPLEPFYPINDDKNEKILKKYLQLRKKEKNVIFGGRLADFKYYDMHHVIKLALLKSQKEIENKT